MPARREDTAFDLRSVAEADEALLSERLPWRWLILLLQARSGDPLAGDPLPRRRPFSVALCLGSEGARPQGAMRDGLRRWRRREPLPERVEVSQETRDP